MRNTMRGARALAAPGLLLLGMALPALAEGDGASLEELVEEQGDRIERLQSEVERLREQQAVTRASALSEDIESYLAETEGEGGRYEGPRSVGGPPSYGRRVRVGGYFSLEFRDDGGGSTMEFDQHRLVPKISADVAEGITFETEIEIEGGGADVDFLSGNEVLVEFAELAFEIVEGKLTFKVGLILIPWGRFNQVHDDPIQDLTDRPIVSRRIAAVPFDQPGIGIEGTLELGEGWFFDYDLALVQGFDDGFSTNGGVRGARQSFRADNNDNKQVFGRFVLSPPVSFLDVLEAGTSFTYGKHDAAGDLANYGWAVDVFLKRGPFEFVGEFMTLRIEQPAGAPVSEPGRMRGWYVEFAYHFFPGHWRGKHVLFTEESTFTLVVRVENADLNTATSGTTFRDDRDQVTIGFNFRPVERTVFKISYTFVDTELDGAGDVDKFVLSWASYF